MPVYVWKGVNSQGVKRKGEVESPDQAAALAHVKRLRIQDIFIKEKPKDLFENIAFFKPKVTGKDIVVFTRQLSTMIDAGLPLIQSLEILAKQQENSTFKNVLTAIKRDVETGTTIADAMRKHPTVFDTLFANMVEAGETGGILDTILSRLAGFKEKSMALQKKIKGAMTYPTICLAISFLILGVILIFVIPVFEEMFSSMGAALPIPTQIVVQMSNFLKSNFLFIIMAIFAIIYGVKKIYKTEKGRYRIDSMLLRAPIIGPLIRKVAVAKFTRTLSTMLQSGVPILDALQVVAKTSGNKVIEGAVFRIAESISEGRPIAEPLEESGVFPNMVVQMINVGESVGALDSMLAKIADFYDEEVDQAVNNLTAMIEPLMMVVLGGMIGGIVVAMYLPIFSVAGMVG
ncbi:MAG: type II secretion system F family protein [Proteobacteria bacterium]|jgi:type IV pilus assembly protein PilC|nr:type II secretion system F family protein [Desulfocapsa sp.]MBU3945785.1 type II secretion system F family protein [Pseudomonadota bacterium]MCG2745431.1 type II secretion system F family protein [Desulfobacteraceae bacterium]MBU4030077.1 type II secretion system F family protein [Pseudomonadota bacterium]MBU4041944.1 type II secretion system F family protein [Pseudomonadota bacterium]